MAEYCLSKHGYCVSPPSNAQAQLSEAPPVDRVPWSSPARAKRDCVMLRRGKAGFVQQRYSIALCSMATAKYDQAELCIGRAERDWAWQCTAMAQQ
jgi:hypothetical protein